MAATDNELDLDLSPFFRVYKNGRVERLAGTESLPAGVDPQTGVTSKDVTDIVPGTEVYVRIFLPKLSKSSNTQKLPLLIYIHGGAFCLFSPDSALFHNYLNVLVAESQVAAVSVHYRRAPEHPLPVAYDDSWAAVQWVASHRSGDGPEALLNQHADFRRVFLAGDSAGGNIAHNLAMRAGSADSRLNLEILGIVLVDPYFWGSDPVNSELLNPVMKALGDRLWPVVCPSCPDYDDPKINPVAGGGPSLTGLGCRRVLVTVSEKDFLRDRGRLYFEALSRSGWAGIAEIHETEGEGHCFHIDRDMDHEKAKERMRRIADFFNRDST
ncbi:putative carboxylesterase 13 [Sesamum angolense]|uniref:Carboxylesterase 13 n=1 Tax=Sesamum angolense TaxID=2727404 RepID=A0AAE1WBZ9_9LAMI|nr:putative carboxylesterase 13 [Sesamum angolense]